MQAGGIVEHVAHFTQPSPHQLRQVAQLRQPLPTLALKFETLIRLTELLDAIKRHILQGFAPCIGFVRCDAPDPLHMVYQMVLHGV